MKVLLRMRIMIGLVFGILVLSGCHSSTDTKPIKSGYVEVDQGKLFYQQFGKGKPMLILHGGPGMDQTYLQPQMLELAKHYELTFYDQRGGGKSLETPMDVSHINLKQFVKDMDAIRQEIGHDKVIVAGHSWGARLAMEYVLAYPEHVSHVILLNGAPGNYKGLQAFFDNLSIKLQPYEKELAPLSDHALFDKLTAPQIHALYRRLFSAYLYDPKDADQLTLTMSVESAESGERVRAIMLWRTAEYDLLPALKNVAVPTLIVHGEADVIPEWTAEDLHHAIPHSELYVMKNCGHFPYIEKPDEFFAKIKGFVGE